MKTKIIPFDKELAEKIQAGEIEGKIIKAINECPVRIICWDRKSDSPIVALYETQLKEEYVISFDDKGEVEGNAIVYLEVPDNEPQFKPFDKVLVTQRGWSYWIPSIYRNQTPDGKHICIDNLEYDLCKPYEEND